MTPNSKRKTNRSRKSNSGSKEALASGSSRFCMGAAWRNPHERDMPYVLDMVREVKALGLETCMTLGMLNASQAERLKDAGLDYYNHNLIRHVNTIHILSVPAALMTD